MFMYEVTPKKYFWILNTYKLILIKNATLINSLLSYYKLLHLNIGYIEKYLE